MRCNPSELTVTTELPGFACPLHAADGRELGVAVVVAAEPHATTAELSAAITTEAVTRGDQ